MKVCTNCYRINEDDAESCVNCGYDGFSHLVVPFYDNAGEYFSEAEYGGKEVDTESD